MGTQPAFAKTPLLKRVQHDIYFRCEELNNSLLTQSLTNLTPEAPILQKRMQNAIKYVQNEYPHVQTNVCRIRLNGEHASFLSYDDLLKPHPELKQSIRVEFDDAGEVLKAKLRKEDAKNPPILHRVENFFLPNTPEFKFHQSVTKHEEQLGVFDFKRQIGRKNEFHAILQQLKK